MDKRKRSRYGAKQSRKTRSLPPCTPLPAALMNRPVSRPGSSSATGAKLCWTQPGEKKRSAPRPPYILKEGSIARPFRAFRPVYFLRPARPGARNGGRTTPDETKGFAGGSERPGCTAASADGLGIRPIMARTFSLSPVPPPSLCENIGAANLQGRYVGARPRRRRRMRKKLSGA